MAVLSRGDQLGLKQSSSASVLIDKWIFAFTAGLLFVTALAGFIPDSLTKLADIEAGRRAPFPLILHVHAVLMGAWLSLLLAQSTLQATGRMDWHRQLGLAAFALLPMMAITFVLVPQATYTQVWEAYQTASPETRERLGKSLTAKHNVILAQFRSGVLFLIFVVLAIRARKSDSGFHRRMMLLGSLVVMGAAINRVPGLPSTMPGSPLSLDIGSLLLIAPLFVWDLIRTGKVHRAYLVAFSCWLPLSIAVHMLWGTPAWQAFGANLLR